MAKTCWLEREKRKAKTVEKYAELRAELKKKGDWLLSAEYVYLGASSYSTNLSDSDFAQQTLNQHGFVVDARYNFTDFLTGRLAYMGSENIRNDFAGVTSSGTANAGFVDLVQVDLSWKF